MGLLDAFLFRKRPPIRDRAGVTEFIDSNAAFLVQKGIYEYSRARAGHYSKVLFGEQGFRDAVEVSRWRAFPLGLAMVTEIVEGILRPHAADRAAQQRALCDTALGIFDRYPVPPQLGDDMWREARAALDHRLKLIGLHPVKPAKDVPEPYIKDYFDMMPIHEKLRGRDFETTRNYMRVAVINMHEEFSKRGDLAAVAASLGAVAAS
jgi:hypothetical protein